MTNRSIEEIATRYSPGEIENKWYSYWKDQGFFHAATNTEKPAYSIVIPPPNITGRLHMGHALNNTLQFKRDRLYCFLALPRDGIAVEKAELPDLPATKALVLQNPKRALRIQPYPHWLEESLEIGTIVIDKKIMSITVEK